MAYLIAGATGNYSTTTFYTGTNTPSIHATTNISFNTGSFSATFTAPSLVDSSIGGLIYVASKGTGVQTMTLTLQEDIGGIGSWLDTTATSTITSANVNLGWVFFKFGTPYTFATTGAGRYRMKIVRSAGTHTCAADSGGTLICTIAVDSRTATPVTNDVLYIIGSNAQTAINITIDGTRTVGNAGTLAANGIPASTRSVTYGVVVGNGGALIFDTSANSQLTCKGSMVIDAGGTFQMGTVASPIPSTQTCKLIFDMVGTADHGFGALDNSIITIQGAPKTSTSLWKTTYVSGVGTTASPLVVNTSVDWAVGDEIIISSTGSGGTNYNESELKFIKTKNSATSYVLSDTSGGVEAAFSFTHGVNAEICNITRNAIITSTSTALTTFFCINDHTVASQANIDWARVENGSTGTGLPAISVRSRVEMDYSVCYKPGRMGFMFTSNNLASQTHTGLIAVGGISTTSTTTSAGMFLFNATKKKTLVDCYAIKNIGPGFVITASFSNMFTRCKTLSCMTNVTSIAGAWFISTSGQLTFSDCEAQANRFTAIMLSSATDLVFNNFLCGNKAVNQTIDINITTDTYNTISFVNSLFSSTTLISNYTNLIAGSEIRLHKLNQTENNHVWYTRFGSARSTGAGLADTTIRTSNSLGLRLAPEDNTDGFVWETKILAKSNSAVSISGFLRKNTAYATDVVMVELFLPGSSTADATTTMSNTTDSWEIFSLAANYTGSVNAYATVRFTAMTITAAAYLYIDDLYNGTNEITALDVWDAAKPSAIMFEQLGDAAAVWAILTSTLTTSGTVGNLVANNLPLIPAAV